jgi:predicted nucleic acid-binding protein
VIHLDTSTLVDALTGPKRAASRLRQLIQDGERMQLSALVLFEWRRGPRLPDEIADQEALFPSDAAVPFGSAEALLAAKIYQELRRPRGRELDIAIAACALAHESQLWTLNPADFRDIPKLHLLGAAPGTGAR